MDHAGAGDAHVDDGVRLAGAVDRAGHKGRVFHHVGKDHQLGGGHALLVAGELGALEDLVGHEVHGVHVDAGAKGRHVHRGAYSLGGGQRLGDGVDEPAVAVADALLHHGREAA